jgi:hypothetical protein
MNFSTSIAPHPVYVHQITAFLPFHHIVLLAQLDINMLMPASSQSTLSLKKDELRARTDPFPCFIDKIY